MSVLKILCFGVFSLMWSFFSMAESDTTDVFCASIDGREWDWLYEDDGTYTSVEGKWGKHTLDPVLTPFPLTSFGYFDIHYNRYQALQNRCDVMGMVAQPALDRFSDWKIFRIEMPSGEKVFAQGFYTINYDFRL
ncbi:hypothetical protein BS333_15460 [Vibrio azureus]|nr:hypothetical protein [Vibrio azureus]AUI87794.1 hypothetical protein BS333_15460 [Vibrio azureus]